MLLARQHRVHDDRALQTDLEFDRGSLGQVPFPELLAAHYDTGPRLGVVGLVSDHQLHRFAELAEAQISGAGAVRKKNGAGQTRNPGEAPEL